MGRNKWSVTRFETHRGGRSYGPAGKYRFETKLVASIVYGLFRFETFLRLNSHQPWLSYIPTYSIDTEMGVSFQDAGPWRSYHIETSGDSLYEMLDNATVSEVDQDGGTLDAYELRESTSQIQNVGFRIISDRVSKQDTGVSK